MTIGESMRAARKKAGIQQKELEEISGISRASISNYETDKNTPLITTVEILADALGISVDKYIGHEVRK